jgi:hypothetical protein
MAIILPSGFNITNNEPVDARFSLADQTARYGLSSANIYEGLVVYQRDDNTLWILIDTTEVSNSNGWQEVSSSEASDVINGRLDTIENFTSSTSARLSSIETITSSNTARINSLETFSASVDTLNTAQNSRLTSLEIKTGSLATTGSNTFFGTQTFSGSVYIKENLIVQGSSSLQSITASAVDIGTNQIILNVDNPAVRFAGISVYDSGSTQGTGSLWWDSTQNHWLYEHPSDSAAPYNSAILISGPKNAGNLGEELGLVNNYIVKAVGGDHISSSAIYDDGSTIALKSNTEVTGSLRVTSTITATNLSGIWSGSAQMPAGVVSGSSQVSFTGLSNVPSGLVSGSTLSEYVPYTGATSNLTMGDYDVTAYGLYVDGGGAGRLGFKQYAGGSSTWRSGYTSISPEGTNFLNFAFAGTEPMYKQFRFDASSLTDLAVRTYSLPDKSGTLATTADVLGTTDSFYIPKVNTITTAFTSSGIYVSDYDDVGIGTTGVSPLGYKTPYRYLTIDSTSNTASGILRLRANGSSAITISSDNGIGYVTSAGSLRLQSSNGSGVVSINTSGQVGVGTANATSGFLHVNGTIGSVSIYASNDIVAFSDISVKKNIRPIENVLLRINNSRGVLYDRADDCDSIDNIGFIAQELEIEFPELVVTNSDGTKAVKYQNATAVLFEAVKEQQKLINSILSKLDK